MLQHHKNVIVKSLKGKELKTVEVILDEASAGATSGSFIPDIEDILEKVNK